MNIANDTAEPASDPEVVVVGAGLAGLAWAERLHRNGVSTLVLESSDACGGRVRTDLVQGYRLDRGFQVFLSAYPEARRVLDLKALDLRRFRPGALVYQGSQLCRLMDVFRCPQYAWNSVRQPVGTFRDKLRVARLRWESRKWTPDYIQAQANHSTEQYLRQFGFTDSMVDGFFRGFYGGIFLERELRTSSRMFQFTFRMFAKGYAVIPALGMGEIPRQLANRLPEGAIRLGCHVESVQSDGLMLQNGERIKTRVVVVATDAASAGRLVPGTSPSEVAWKSVTGLYYAADRSPLQEAIIALNGTSRGLVNNVCVLSDVSPLYAPPEKALISVSVLGRPVMDGLEYVIQEELVGWFGEQVREWSHLRTDVIERALPEQLPTGSSQFHSSYTSKNGIYVCGDHCTSSSIEGAITSGVATADAILAARDKD